MSNLWPVNDPTIALTVIITIVAIFVLVVIVARRRSKATDEALKQTAAAHGWTLARGQEGGYYVDRWTGATDGVPWVAESLRQISAGKGKARRARRISRWRGAFAPGVSKPIVCIGVRKGQEQSGTAVAQGDGFLATLAQQAATMAYDHALGTYFGDGPTTGLDPAKMHRVDAQRIPGYMVMAEDEGEGARVLSEGIERALIDATSGTSSIVSEDVRPWILITKDAIALARIELHSNDMDVERFAQAGPALTRAFRFGRRSA